MNRYRLNIEVLCSMVPFALRKVRLLSLLQVLVYPISAIHRSFLNFCKEKNKRLNYTGQVFSLAKAVNEYCENEKCFITDGEYLEETMLPYDGAGELANHQVHIPFNNRTEPQVYVLYEGFSHVAQNDFIVHLPAELNGKIDESGLRTIIDEYKIAGKMYNIVYNQ